MALIVNDTRVTNPIDDVSGKRLHEESGQPPDRKVLEEPFLTSDSVEISEEGRNLSKSEHVDKKDSSGQTDLTEEEKREVEALKKRDRDVKAHEMAHMAAGGGLVRGGPAYDYQTGPDGKRYAVGGHVSIDSAPEKDPEKTIKKMAQVKRAALAPADPSGEDLSVAAKASQTEAKARSDLAKEKIEESVETNKTDDSSSPAKEPAVQENAYETPPVTTTFSVTI